LYSSSVSSPSTFDDESSVPSHFVTPISQNKSLELEEALIAFITAYESLSEPERSERMRNLFSVREDLVFSALPLIQNVADETISRYGTTMKLPLIEQTCDCTCANLCAYHDQQTQLNELFPQVPHDITTDFHNTEELLPLHFS